MQSLSEAHATDAALHAVHVVAHTPPVASAVEMHVVQALGANPVADASQTPPPEGEHAAFRQASRLSDALCAVGVPSSKHETRH